MLAKIPTTRAERTPTPVAAHTPPRAIGFLVHHHGSGHIKRCSAIIDHIDDRPVTIFCAQPERFPTMASNVTLVPIPNPHGQPSCTPALHHQSASTAMDCAPLGVSALREGMGTIARWLATADAALLASDVSAEVVLLARILSVPAIKLRMHGNRTDAAHVAAYSACVGLLAPFDERLEQADWPARFRQKTCYTGVLIDSRLETSPSRELARQRLGLPLGKQVIVAITGSGAGSGTPLAPLTVGARALPDAQWFTLGNTARYGHETAFSNLCEVGWVDNAIDYIVAADVVIATPGDTLIHEVARVGRPLVCIPEWCYYDEQACKAEALDGLQAASYSPTWPGSFPAWQALIERALAVSPSRRKVNSGAAVISVLTLVRGRQSHLDRLLASLCLQYHTEFEVVIASMQAEAPRIDPNLPFPVRLVEVPGVALPLAAAHNAAAAAASGAQLIFLDVDCIAAPSLVGNYGKWLTRRDIVLMGEVHYLPALDYTDKSFAQLAAIAQRHPARPVVPSGGLREESNPRCLWGLSFALRRDRFQKVDGLNERYIGYGGEETDFAERLATVDTAFAWCPHTLALHQYHSVYSPPLDKFTHIVRNARLFHAT